MLLMPAGSVRRLCNALLLVAAACGELCAPNEPVLAFFAGQVELEGKVKDCTPDIDECRFSGKVHSGPDADGQYLIDWDDSDDRNRKVHHSQVHLLANGEVCDGPGVSEWDQGWVPPEIPCTLLARLHWEASEPAWNEAAVRSLKTEFEPDEVIDGFDWHVVLRFYAVDRCEAAFYALDAVLKKCTERDPEACRVHEYVKAIEYVGDDPATRRKTGRHLHKEDGRTKAQAGSKREEL
eukprot:gb/GFBE01024119.1/.p1 GENE.gb/GFBE01024119.1/~~gb/GFBE01024119.1/.p1  ORF type:complete len:237 (+),score=57.90 gb/GFBE01024119.1/:1-711(+)